MPNNPTSNAIVHARYLYNLDKQDEQGRQKYTVVYFESNLEDVNIKGFTPIEDLDSIPELSTDNDSLMELVKRIDALIKKTQRDYVPNSDVVLIATPNKILRMDSSGKLQATADNSDKLGGRFASEYALKSEIDINGGNASSLQGHTADEFIFANKASSSPTPNNLLYLDHNGKNPATSYDSDKLGGVASSQYALKSEIPELSTDAKTLEGHPANYFLPSGNALTEATANKLLYLNDAAKLPATAADADKLGGKLASQYALKSEIPELSTDAKTLEGHSAADFVLTTATSKTAKPNMLVYLDSSSKLPATANNAENLGGMTPEYYATASSLETKLGKKEKAESAKTADNATNVSWSGVTGKPGKFTGASMSISSNEGFVPQAQAGDQNKFLKADGTWSNPPDNDNKVLNTQNNTVKAYITGTTTATTNTDTQVFDNGVYLAEEEGTLVAKVFRTSTGIEIF